MEYDHWLETPAVKKKMTGETDIWEKWRYRVDSWRIVPRVLIALYGCMCYNVAEWFMGLVDPSMAQVTFVSTVWGAAAAWFAFYVNSGIRSPNAKKSENDSKE
jgi:hypothetical protein